MCSTGYEGDEWKFVWSDFEQSARAGNCQIEQRSASFEGTRCCWLEGKSCFYRLFQAEVDLLKSQMATVLGMLDAKMMQEL